MLNLEEMAEKLKSIVSPRLLPGQLTPGELDSAE